MSISQLLSPVFGQRCASCAEPGPALCRPCRFALASSRAVDHGGGIQAAMPFDGVGRSAILALKYGNRRPVAAHLARLLVRRLQLAAGPRFDVVTWAPTSSARVRSRGFDQAELIAREVARELGVPCRRLLHRSHGAPQTGRDRAQRLRSDGPGFRSRPGRRGLRVLVVDDVVTTGGTLVAAARALHAAGVHHVRLVAVAATLRGAAGDRRDRLARGADVVQLADRREQRPLSAMRRPVPTPAAAPATAPPGTEPAAARPLRHHPGGAPVGSIPA